MAAIAGLKDFRKHGPPADIGTFQFSPTALVFPFTFSGATTYVAIRAGVSGWVLIDQNVDPAIVVNSCFAAGGAGTVVALREGDFVALTGVAATANNQGIYGVGEGTYWDATALLTGVHGFTISGYTGCELRNFATETSAGVFKTCHCVFIEDGANNFHLIDLTIINSDTDGIHIEGTTITQGHIHRCHINGADYSGIHVNMDDANFMYRLHIEDCDVGNCGYSGIYFVASAGNLYCEVVNNVVYSCGQTGIYVWNGNYSMVRGNICVSSGHHGIYLASTDHAQVLGNISYLSVRHGIYIDVSSNNTIVGNACNENDSGDVGIYDGICIEDDSDYNRVMENTCNENGRWGISIGIAADDCVENRVKNNTLRGNTSGAFFDGGTDTKLATKIFQFIQGTAFISDSASAKGWEINAVDEWAIALGQLPLEVQQVVRIKIWAVALGAPIDAGGQMHLDILINGGESNLAYTTETIGLVSFDGEEADYVNADVVHWLIDSGDDADIDAFVAGMSVECKVIYQAGDDPDGATNATFRAIEVEYV